MKTNQMILIWAFHGICHFSIGYMEQELAVDNLPLPFVSARVSLPGKTDILPLSVVNIKQ